MSTIDAFLKHYVREIDYYAEAARLAQGLLESELSRRGIRAIVTSRPKNPDRLRQKLIERNKTKNYQSIEDIYTDIVDLAGVRVALYFPGDQQKVDSVITELFQLIVPVKIFPEANPKTRAKGLAGYLARHYRVQIRQEKLSQAQKRYSSAQIEIQAASVLMHAWAEVEHDLLYKPLKGKPSTDEIAILDELNGMVLAGEIALERLQRSIESRVAEPKSQFANEYELQTFLSSKIPVGRTQRIGVIDFLYQLLQDADLNTPSDLVPYLEKVELADDGQPISDQLIDLITAEDPQKYQLFLSIWKKFRDKFTYSDVDILPQPRQDALGTFLEAWIDLERRIIKLAGTSSRFLTQKVIEQLSEKYHLDPKVLLTIHELRHLRNEVVHGVSIPNAHVLKNATDEIRFLLDSKLPK
ncbi:MAG TPA: RelA/SpoT domain-containing protein [Candidatus Angelobacter sp.]|nr:RelA/SpoT domain-containing protein [Candidatus Angelobacter sp.]